MTVLTMRLSFSVYANSAFRDPAYLQQQQASGGSKVEHCMGPMAEPGPQDSEPEPMEEEEDEYEYEEEDSSSGAARGGGGDGASTEDEAFNLTHFGIHQALPVEGEPDWELGGCVPGLCSLCANAAVRVTGAQSTALPAARCHTDGRAALPTLLPPCFVHMCTHA